MINFTFFSNYLDRIPEYRYIFFMAVTKSGTLKPRVNSVAKALQILECFSPQQAELNLTQLSRMLKMPKSTLLNMIRTLEDAGYLFKACNSQNYRLGFKLMELSYNVRASLPVVQYAAPFMEELQPRGACGGGPEYFRPRHDHDGRQIPRVRTAYGGGMQFPFPVCPSVSGLADTRNYRIKPCETAVF
jgi:hypothetical protein